MRFGLFGTFDGKPVRDEGERLVLLNSLVFPADFKAKSRFIYSLPKWTTVMLLFFNLGFMPGRDLLEHQFTQ